MIVLIPVQQFAVQYEVVGGRPYSTFERLVLRSIYQGVGTLADLEAEFKVHSRLIIEALVTLTQAGWIAVGERGFSLTAQGHKALDGGGVPETRVREAKLGRIIMERLTGGLVPNTRATFVSDMELKDLGKLDSSLRLTPRVHDWELDEGQVQSYLQHRRNEWITRIGPIKASMKGSCWLPVNVDPNSDRVSLLPSEWQGRLEDIILKESSTRSPGLSASKRSERWTQEKRRPTGNADEPGDTWGTRWNIDQEQVAFLFSGSSHRALLLQALEKASRFVFIVTTFLRASVINEIYPYLRQALERGVSVDILWGYNGSEEGSGIIAIQALKKIVYDCSSLPGRLRFNGSAAGSHAKLLLWDEGNQVHSCVGSYNWLSARYGEAEDRSAETNVSACVSHVGFVSSIARTMGALWSRLSAERLGSSRARLDVIAAELERREVSSESAATGEIGIGLVRDFEHEGLLFALMRSSKKRFFLASHQLGPVALARLAPIIRRAESEQVKVSIAYGQSNLPAEDLDTLMKAKNVTVLNIEGIHAKICIGDEVGYVGSYNFLSTDPYGTSSRSREVGVVLRGPNAVKGLLLWAEGHCT